MSFSFNPLWKMLIEKNMTKEDLRTSLNLSPTTIAKMGKGQYVSLEVIDRICNHLKCGVSEVIEHTSNNERGNANER